MAAEPTIVVLGAGINGAAIARELTLSGAGVIVVDGDDVASGSTAWSTRLIHGGLRYLEHGEIGLVRESLVERNRLVRLAPHLVRPLPFYLPMERRFGGLAAAAARVVGAETLARRWQGRGGRGSWTVGLGLTLYDLLAAGAGWRRHRGVRAGSAGLPAVDPRRFPRGAVYADAQLLYPERFTVELLVDARSSAAALGTRFEVCTHRRVRVGGDGRVEIGAVACGGGAAGGGAFAVRADAIVNATGAWVDRTLEAVLPEAAGRRLIGGTKGSHLLLRSPPLRSALADHGVYCEASDGRPAFVLPFGPELVLVGTTDIPFSGDPAAARAEEAEVDYLLAATARIFPDVGVGRADVQQHYCGVRPLPFVGAGAGTPAGITRRHQLVRHRGAGLPVWSVVGGKLTTCRSLAETTANTVLGALGVPVRGTSRERPLPGACAGQSRVAAVHACRDLAAGAGTSRAEAERAAEHAVGLFGARAPDVWRAGGAPRRGLIRGIGLPAAAVEFCVRAEWAATLDDLIERRLMLSLHARLSREAITDVAEAFSAVGGLPSAEVPAAVEACVTRLFDRYGRRVPQAATEGVAAAGSMERSQR